MHSLTYERENIGGRGHVLRHQHHEDRHGQQRGDAHGDLLTRVAGDVEAEQRHQRDEDAGQDHVEDVEERPPSDEDVAGDVRVRLGAARVHLDISLHPQVHQLPLAVGDVVGDVALRGVDDEVDVVAVVGPRREEHGAVLDVEGEVTHIDRARGLEDDHGQPRHIAVCSHDDVSADRREERRHVSAGKKMYIFKIQLKNVYSRRMLMFIDLIS